MLTSEQVRVYRSLEEQYPEHLPPKVLADDSGDDGLFFVVEDKTDEMDCGGDCGHPHVDYIVILPSGDRIGGFLSETIRSGSTAEAMLLPPQLHYENATDVPVEAWDVEYGDEVIRSDDERTILESNPWLSDLGF